MILLLHLLRTIVPFLSSIVFGNAFLRSDSNCSCPEVNPWVQTFLRAFSGIMFVLSLVFLLPLPFKKPVFLLVSLIVLVLQIVWAILTLQYVGVLRQCGCETSTTASENEWSAVLILWIVLFTVVLGGAGYIYASI